MRLAKLTITVLFIASFGIINTYRCAVSSQDQPASNNCQRIASYLEDSPYAAILPRDDQAGKKTPASPGSVKHTFAATSHFPLRNGPLHNGDSRSLIVAAGGVNEGTLVSLRCLLTL